MLLRYAKSDFVLCSAQIALMPALTRCTGRTLAGFHVNFTATIDFSEHHPSLTAAKRVVHILLAYDGYPPVTHIEGELGVFWIDMGEHLLDDFILPAWELDLRTVFAKHE